MSYCPKCKAEYRDGFKKCSACNVDLVESMPHKEISKSEKERENRHKIKPQPELGSEIPLVTIDEQIEFIYITSQLEVNEIPYRAMERGMGQYLRIYLGISYTGKTIFIDKKNFKQAEATVKSYKAELVK